MGRIRLTISDRVAVEPVLERAIPGDGTKPPVLSDGFHLFRSGQGRLALTSTEAGLLSWSVTAAGAGPLTVAEIEAGQGLVSGQAEVLATGKLADVIDLSAQGQGDYEAWLVMRNGVGESAPFGPVTISIGAAPSEQEVLIDIVVSVLGELSSPREQDWWVWPTGDAGQARLELPGSWYGGYPVEAVEYRVQAQDATPDSRVLGDPTGIWSAWTDTGIITGVTVLKGLPEEPCCVQIRTLRNGIWSLHSTHKRIGLRFFDYDDTVSVVPGCVAETIPATVRWGTLNAAGEGGQRVPDDTTAIASGDAGGHFEVVTTNGRKYLVPTAAGVAAWAGGETYTLTLDDAGASTVNVSVEADAAALMSYAYGKDAATIVEYEALCGRVADFSGKTIYLRPNAYFWPGGLSTNQLRNHEHFYGLSAPVTIRSDDPAQPAVWSGWNVTLGNADRKIAIHDVTCHAPQFANFQTPGFGSQNSVEIWSFGADAGASSLEIGNVTAFTDGIESRYGFHVRGNGVEKVELTTFALSGTGIHVHDCRSLYCYYPLKLEGVEGVIERGLVSHVEGDYFNPQPSGNGRSPIVRNMRCREHCGDQGNVHSDAFHIWSSGVHDGLRIEGNVWLTGYEGRACPGQVPAAMANQPLAVQGDVILTAAEIGPKSSPTQACMVVGLTDLAPDITVTAPDPAGLAGGQYFAVCNFGQGRIHVTDGGAFSFTLSGAQEKAVFYTAGGAWNYDPPNKSFQGLFNNNGTQDYADTAWRFNVIQGLTAPTAVQINGTGIADRFFLHNNSLMTNLLTIEDDIDGNGIIDSRDGDPTDALPKIQLQKPGVTADFKNVVSGRWDNNTRADLWDDWYLGRADQDSVAHREEVFLNADGRGFRPPETFAQAIEAARPRPDGPLAAARIGAVGPTDDAVGFWNFPAGRFNGYPAILPAFSAPAQGGVAIPEQDLVLWFDYPVQLLDPAGFVLREAATGAALAVTTMVTGRAVTLSQPGLADATVYEVEVAPGAVAVWDSAADAYVGHAGASWRFTADARARPNVIFARAGLDLYQGAAWIDPALAGFSIIDTNNQAAAVIPAGPAQHQIEVEAGQGTAEAMLTIYDGGSFVPAYSSVAQIDRATGAFSETLSGGDVAGTAIASFCEPGEGGWRFVWQTDWAGRVSGSGKSPRYVLRWDSNGAGNRWRRISLFEKHVSGAPWVPTASPWEAS